MNRDDLIDKIKKLLALSNANGATEPEKNLALNKAKDLMAQYAIDECQLKNGDAKQLIEIVEYKPALENPMPAYLSDPAIFCAVISPIAKNFGCYAAFKNNSPGISLFYGFSTNLEIAKYACDVLLNAGIKDFRYQYKQQRSIGFAYTFWNGFAEGITNRFTKLSNETAIVLYDKVKAKFEAEIRIINITLPSSTEQSGHLAGMKSATEAQLNPAVSKGNGGNLLR